MSQSIQSFAVEGGPALGRENLPKLRAVLAEAELDAFLIPHEDEFNNEYLPERAERLMWATGFSGSAGAAVVTAKTAAVFVDGRYTLQAQTQVDPDLFEVRDLVEEGLAGWIETHAENDWRVGYDPRVHSQSAVDRLKEAAERAGAQLVKVETNLVDQAWTDQPPPPQAPVAPHPIEYAGEAHEDKRARIGEAVASLGADVAVITEPASIAWLLNIRGGDVAHSPLALSAFILGVDGTGVLFIDEAKLTDAARAHLGNAVAVQPMEAFEKGLAGLAGRTVQLDPKTASAWVVDQLTAAGARVRAAQDPIALPKARKNETEAAGARSAHLRDGAALSRFLHWLDTEAQSGEVDEIEAALKLEAFRSALPEFRDLSFRTISAAGPNAAFAHYRVDEESNRTLERGSLYLVDSGGQYFDGTTDVTRTVPIGDPAAAMRHHFTLVLRGHIALAKARFPKGTTGVQLDILARKPLWEAGLDYDHGTGHGVGSYLGVHESPQRIAKSLNATALEPGMILSNEPGYYRVGKYGIRIENLVIVTEPEAVEGGEREMLGFETLTLAPIHRGLIEPALLSPAEMGWIDRYHAKVRERIGPLLDGEAAEWLQRACEPLYGATP